MTQYILFFLAQFYISGTRPYCRMWLQYVFSLLYHGPLCEFPQFKKSHGVADGHLGGIQFEAIMRGQREHLSTFGGSTGCISVGRELLRSGIAGSGRVSVYIFGGTAKQLSKLLALFLI